MNGQREIEAGQQLLHYRLIEKIGEGGMGVVWKAEDTRLHRQVALKFVPEELAGGSERVDRHLREARAASALNHPHICSIFDIGEWYGRRFIVMELLEGRTLQERIGSRPLPVEEVAALGSQIAGALSAAHAKGIVHRDIKTTNLFVVPGETGAPRAKILDFGLAKRTAVEDDPASAETVTHAGSHQTEAGAVVGTISYMSPEQALGKELDHRTDIFALGAVLYEMLTARRAFDGASPAAIFDGILNRAPAPLTALNPEVPAELERIVFRALEKDPELRYQSAADLRADLERLRRGATSERSAGSPPPVPPGMHRRSRHLAGLLGLLLAVAVTALVVQQLSKQDPSLPPPPAPARPGTGATSSSGPSIAVLPFVNASGDPDQEYFSDGLTEDIITELSRYHELSVIARNSTQRYKGNDVDLRQIGAALGSRYVLQGSVRRAGERLRISVELSSTADGLSVWATTYERDLTARDLFELQDELALTVVNAIAGSYGALTRAELPGARRRPPASLVSYDCVLRTYEYLQVHVAENHLAARDCLVGVLEADPDYAEGKAWLAYLYADQFHHRWHDIPEEEDDSLDRALDAAEAAVRLDPTSHVAHGALALTLLFRGDVERGKSEAYRAVELNPNNAIWLSLLGNYLAQQEDFEHSVPMSLRALELSPHPPSWITMGLFYDHYRQGRFEEALAMARGWDNNDFRKPLYLAATYGRLGRTEEARRQIEELKSHWDRPLAEARHELVHRHGMKPSLADALLEGLRGEGLEIEAGAPAP